MSDPDRFITSAAAGSDVAAVVENIRLAELWACVVCGTDPKSALLPHPRCPEHGAQSDEKRA